MRNLIRTATLALLAVTFALMTGCVSHSYGKKVDRNQINTIQKGVTTREQVESLAGGPPTGPPQGWQMNPNGNGGRTGIWTYTDTRDAMSPISGHWYKNQQYRQTLTVMLNKNEVVEDYTYAAGTDTPNGFQPETTTGK